MILAGTGHRPDKLGGYYAPARCRLQDFAMHILPKYRPDIVISGMALGWDTALAYAAYSHKIPVHAYIPFKGQETRWPQGDRQTYRDFLDRAEKVVVCSDGEYVVWKMQERNKQMVDNATAVLALWNGTSGGTANCVDYASKKGVEIINVWDEWCEYRIND